MFVPVIALSVLAKPVTPIVLQLFELAGPLVQAALTTISIILAVLVWITSVWWFFHWYFICFGLVFGRGQMAAEKRTKVAKRLQRLTD